MVASDGQRDDQQEVDAHHDDDGITDVTAVGGDPNQNVLDGQKGGGEYREGDADQRDELEHHGRKIFSS
ncbi:hypothetical protein GCM10008994_17980 [Halorubrum ejinorense]|uniref:Uncharacterized protein n=1 Tax=Halorubrum ejinorense TaxID=425309 RepID=A0AAV3STD8_9EURY